MKFNLETIGKKIQSFFDKDLVAKVARKTKFVRRESPLNGRVFLQALVFGCIEKPTATLKHWAQVCLDLGVTITPQGFDERINEYSLEFLRAMFDHAMKRFRNDIPLPVDILQQFTAINIVDSSTKSLPDNLRAEYPGTGGNGPAASLKVQLVFEFLLGNLEQIALRPGREPDQKYRAYLDIVKKGSLNLLDLGYFCLDAFKEVMDRQAYFLTRYLYGTGLSTPRGEPIDLLPGLQEATTSIVDREVRLGAGHQLPCRLIAFKVPQEVADRRRQKARETAQRKGRTPSKARLALLDWTIFVTNVPAALLSPEQVAVLYRVRWQIELVFKLWKSYCGLKRIAGVRKERVLTELYGKMIGIVLTHFLIAPIRMPEGSGAHREISPVQVRKILGRFARELDKTLHQLSEFVNVLAEMFEHIAQFGFKEKRRKEPNVCHLLTLISTIFDLEENCDMEYSLSTLF
jgi:hypothetical protein